MAIGESVMQEANGGDRPSFEVQEINRADDEMVIVVRGKFAEAVSHALMVWHMDLAERKTEAWKNKFNPALWSLGQFVRDAGRILRGEPADRFPIINRMGIVSDASAYDEAAPPIEDTADTADMDAELVGVG